MEAVSTGTSIAVLTYIGFDGISTLSEEAHNPRRNILLATVLVCLMTGVLAARGLRRRNWSGRIISFPDVDTAFVSSRGSRRSALFQIVNLSALVATIGWAARTWARPGCSTAWAGTIHSERFLRRDRP